MIAALPMYDRPENAAAHDALWALIRDGLRARGIDAPDALDRATSYDAGWGRDDLVLGQICNLPYRARFRDRVTAIGAADHDLPDCPPGHYHSIWILRADDPAADPLTRAGRFAYNDGLSHSGWGAPWAAAAARDVRLTPHLRTGGHAESLRAVAEGRADLAAIDAITWRNLARWSPHAGAVRVAGRTGTAPGMTFIAAGHVDPAPRLAAIAEAIAALPQPERDILGLRGIVALPQSAYDLPFPPDPDAIGR